jgi:hypothetical protein
MTTKQAGTSAIACGMLYPMAMCFSKSNPAKRFPRALRGSIDHRRDQSFVNPSFIHPSSVLRGSFDDPSRFLRGSSEVPSSFLRTSFGAPQRLIRYNSLHKYMRLLLFELPGDKLPVV